MTHDAQESIRHRRRSQSVLVLGAIASACLSGNASAQLTPEWSAIHTGVDGFFFGFQVPVNVVTDSAGAVYMSSSINRSRFTDILTAKYASDGTLVWSVTYDGPSGNPDSGIGITIDSAGDILVLGQSECDFLVIKYDASNGSVIWTSQHDSGNCPESATAITTDDVGNLYVTGYSWPPGTDHQQDFYTYKMDSAGTVLWTATYDGPGQPLFGNDIAMDIAIDANGDVLVTGPSNNGGGHPDYVTIKYSGVDGTQLWLARLAVPVTGQSVALLVSPENDVYVTGASTNGFTPLTTVKYDGNSGSEMWVSVNALGTFGHAFGMALDSQGDVYVTGRLDPDSDRSTLNENVITMRLRASDGVLQWLSIYGDSQQGKYDEGLAIAIDAQDNVLVAGSTNSFGDDGLLLLMYDAATGQIVDQGTFEVPGMLIRGLDMTLDDAQNIVVGGTVRGRLSGLMDSLVLRYPSQVGCLADLTGSTDPNDPGFGVPDGILDANDFFFYLVLFSAGDLAADLTGSVNPNDPSYGIPDGVIDANDFFFYLDLFAQGCP